MQAKQRVLTGITTSGTPHLGNYLGALKPAVAASQKTDTDSFYFLADYPKPMVRHVCCSCLTVSIAV